MVAGWRRVEIASSISGLGLRKPLRDEAHGEICARLLDLRRPRTIDQLCCKQLGPEALLAQSPHLDKWNDIGHARTLRLAHTRVEHLTPRGA